MRKIYFILAMLFIGNLTTLGQPFTGTYNFANVTTTSGLTDPTPVPTATGVTFGSFTAVGQTTTNPNATGRFSFTGWPTGATNGSDVFSGSISTTQYYQVTITPAVGYTIDINSITFTIQRSGTGIRQYAVRSSVDGYSANLPASINPANAALSVVPTNVFQITDATTTASVGSTITLDASFDNLSSAVIFRFYGWNAEASGGTFSIDDVAVSGTATLSGGGPLLSASALTGFGNVCINSTAGPNSFTITGSSLTTADVTVSSLSGFSFSTSSGGSYTASLTLPQGGGAYSQDVFVKFTPTAVQSYNGNIVVGGGGATSINVAASGAGINTAPTVTAGAASNITGTTADVAGTITVTGCSAVTAYGIEYSTTNGFTPGTGTQVAGGTLTAGAFTSNLTGLTAATTYYFVAYATNGAGTSYSSQSSFTTLLPEPTNHATAFACGTTTSSAIPLTWADATGGTVPGGYLIKWSSVGFGSITDPVDGTPESNGAGVQNVAAGVQAYTATGLTAGTTYYFKIFPYTNSGSIIDYKIDGTVPQTSCTTGAAPIAAWDFTGLNTVATATATTFSANLVSASGASDITRGAGAAASAGANSFRTTGFQNNGIATSNTDYFQVTLTAQPGYALSLSSIDGFLNGTSGYAVSPGVSNQFAYSLDGTNFTLIGSPTVTIGQPVALPAIDLTGVSALQNVAAGTTITLRYYASGQTTTGGWGFYSSAAGVNGLAIGGSVAVSSTPNIVASVTSLSAFSSTSGVPSAEQNYTVSGTNLTNDIIVTPPAGFEVSTTSGSGFVTNPSFLTLPQSGGTVNTTTIYVRMNSVTVGANSGNIDNASTGATTKSVALTGSVLASEPTTQSSITFGTITNNSIDVNFSGGNGAKRIVLAKTSTAVNSDPVDGTTYTANAAFGSGTQLGTGNYVVYAGTGNTVTVTGLNGGATYHFAVYEYNDGNTSGAENYFVTTPGTGNATTTASSVTYTWVGGNSSWATPANWSPVRTAGASTDILQFNDGTTVAVTDVPTETIGQLLISAGTQVTLSAAASATLTVGGLAGTDFSVQDGSTLTVSGANALIITLVTGATGSITNSSGITLTGGGHRLIAADAGGVTFGNNAVFTAGTGLSGNPFGGAGTTANSVVFGSGSTFLQIAGSNPFALTQPASVVVFQTGSLYKLQAGLTPSISGRTYANFEFDAAATVSAAASAKFSVDDLRVTNGTLNLGLTGTPGHTIKGNIYVSAGATLNFNPASAGTVNMNGTSTQAITGLGTLTVGVNETFNFDNASGISFTGGNAAFGPLVLTNGKVSLGSSNFSASSITGGSSSNYIITNSTGTVTVNNITTGPAIFPVGPDIFRYNPVTIENGSGHNWSVRVADTITANSGFNTDKAVLLSWIITPSVNPPAAGADVTFQFDEATQVGTSFNAATNVQAWHRVAGAWLRSGIPVAVNTTVPNAATVKVTGLTGFSQYGLSNIDGPLPVVFGTVKATQQSSGGVKVEWSNLTETDVINYAVERSADGRRFTSIGTVNARLNNGGKADYSLVDGSPFSGVNFYRIKSLEIGAKTKYSIIVRVDTRGGATQLVLYPNPVTGGQLSYSAVNLAKGQYALRIFNAAGQLMYNQAINHPGGSVTEAIPMPLVKAGVYTLQLNSADVNLSRTFVVQ